MATTMKAIVVAFIALLVWSQGAFAQMVVAVPASTSGIWLVKELFPKLGIAETHQAGEAK